MNKIKQKILHFFHYNKAKLKLRYLVRYRYYILPFLLVIATSLITTLVYSNTNARSFLLSNSISSANPGTTGSLSNTSNLGVISQDVLTVGIFVLLTIGTSLYFWIDYRQHNYPLKQADSSVKYSFVHHLRVVTLPLLKFKWKPLVYVLSLGLLTIVTLLATLYINISNVQAASTVATTIDQKTGTADPNPSYTSVFEVVFSEAIDKSTFTGSDITLAGTAPGQAIQSITESGSFDKTTYDIRIEATGSGTITPSIAADVVNSLNNPGDTNLASSSTDNSVTYDGTYQPDEFVITLGSDGDYIRTPAYNTYGTTYNYDVDWDNDGTYDQFGLTNNASYFVGVPGDFIIRIKGVFPRVFVGPADDIDVNQWGTNQWSSMNYAFRNANEVVFSAYDAPDLSLVTDMSYAFEGSDFNTNINHWNTSNVSNMAYAFAQTTSFNQPLDNWDVSNVTTMEAMFTRATAFNQPLDNWDVSNVTTMEAMFTRATAFNQPLDNWDTSNVSSMNMVFLYATAFNQPLNNWDVSSVTDMHGMFDSAEAFDQPLNDWDVSNVQLMGAMFEGSNFNQPINNWDVSNVINMSGMFYGNTVFNQPLNNWTTTSLGDTNQMFYGATSFNQPLDNWDVSNVFNMALMFTSATSFNQPLNNWDVSSLLATYGMFGLSSFNQPLDNWDTSSLGDASAMFYGNTDFDQSLANWDMSNVVSVTDMFANGAGLSTVNYDATLQSWSAQSLQNGLTFEAGTSTFCNADIARQAIIDSFSWTINDAGKDCGLPPAVTTGAASNITKSSASTLGTTSPADVTSRGIQYGKTNSYGKSAGDLSALTYAVSDQWGSNGTGNGQFNIPYSIAGDSENNIYVTDPANNRVQKFDSDGGYISQWGSSGAGNGQFNLPLGIAIDSQNNIYVTDQGNERVQKFDSDGVYITEWSSSNSDWRSIAIDSSDNIYVGEVGTKGYPAVEKFNSSGNFIMRWGALGTGNKEFDAVLGIAIDSNDDIYVSDFGNNRIQKFDSDGTYLTKWGTSGSGNGQFNYPMGIAVDKLDKVYIADSSNNRIQQFDSNGVYISQWGTSGAGAGQFAGTGDVSIAANGNLYVTDGGNSRIQKYVSPINSTISGLSCNTTYHYRAFATNPSGTGYGDDATFKTTACATPTTPTTPTTPDPDPDPDPSPTPSSTSTSTEEEEESNSPGFSSEIGIAPIVGIAEKEELGVQSFGFLPAPLYAIVSKVPSGTAQFISWLLLLILLVISLIYGYKAYRKYQETQRLTLQLAKLRSTKQATDNYLSITNHYLNTPVAIMSGAIELLASLKKVPANTLEHIQKVIANYKADIATLAVNGQLSTADSTVNSQDNNLTGTAVLGSNAGATASTTSNNNPPTVKGNYFSGLLAGIPRSGSAFRKRAVYLPVAIVSLTLAIVVFMFANAQVYVLSPVQIGLQVLCLVLLSLVLAANYKQRDIQDVSQQVSQQAINEERQLLKQRSTFIKEATSVLDGHYENINIATRSIASLPEAKTLMNGLAMLGDTSSSLNKVDRLTSLSTDAPVLNLNQETTKLITDLNTTAAEKNITLNVDIPEDLRLAIQPEELKQLVTSSVDNAIKYSPEDSKVDIKAKQQGKQVVLSITDQGPGIAKDKLSELFQPFTKANDIQTYDHPGLGLNLYVDKLVTSKLGGTIQVANTRGNKGTITTIKLPSTNTKINETPRLVVPE